MGTSNRYGGPESSSALIPTWLDEPEPESPLATSVSDDDLSSPQTNDSPVSPRQPTVERRPLASPAPANRFNSARRSFNSAAGTGDRTALRRAVSKYVKTGAGGARSATHKMGGARRATGRVASFLQDVRTSGVETALTNLGFAHLVGQPAEAALAALTDAFCPPGGPIDQAIVRDAWDEAVLALADEGIVDLSEVTQEQWYALLKDFITNAIEARVFNEIGSEGISLPPDIAAIDRLHEDLHDIIRGAVDDAVDNRFDDQQTMTQSEIQVVIDGVYDYAFAYLEALEE
jgi:hypothetical protein